MKPTALIVTTERWFSTARLALGLARAGFAVEAVCRSHHPLTRTAALSRRHSYDDRNPLRSIEGAIAAASPNLIIPADDPSTRHLHQLHSRGLRNGTSEDLICATIERSLGVPEGFSALERRIAIAQLARAAGIRVPETEAITCPSDLRRSLARFGFPAVLKTDDTSGGTGVRIVHALEEAESALSELESSGSSWRSLIHRLLQKARSVVRPQAPRVGPVVIAQELITGCDAISEVACWRGEVLASLHFEVLSKQYAQGPASVVRLIERPAMDFAVKTIVRELGLSGLHGFDFILEGETGDPYLIEINPRATQVGHLALGPGRDLMGALYAAATETTLTASRKITEDTTIALFPQEWIAHPASDYIKTAYHDVPWDEPELIRICILGGSAAPAPSPSPEGRIPEVWTVREPSPSGD